MKKTLLAVAGLWSAAVSAAITLSVETDHANALYRCGETATFTVTAKDDAGAPLQGAFTARLDNFGPKVVATAEVDLAKTNAFTLTGQTNGKVITVALVNATTGYVVAWGYTTEVIA